MSLSTLMIAQADAVTPAAPKLGYEMTSVFVFFLFGVVFVIATVGT